MFQLVLAQCPWFVSSNYGPLLQSMIHSNSACKPVDSIDSIDSIDPIAKKLNVEYAGSGQYIATVDIVPATSTAFLCDQFNLPNSIVDIRHGHNGPILDHMMYSLVKHHDTLVVQPVFRNQLWFKTKVNSVDAIEWSDQSIVVLSHDFHLCNVCVVDPQTKSMDTKRIDKATISCYGDLFAYATNTHIEVVSHHTDTCIVHLEEFPYRTFDVQWNHDGSLFLCIERNIVWNRTDKIHIYQWNPDQNTCTQIGAYIADRRVYCVDWNVDNDRIVFISDTYTRKKICVYTISTCTCVSLHESTALNSAVKWNPKHDQITYTTYTQVNIFDVKTRTCLLQFPARTPHTLSWHPNGRLIGYISSGFVGILDVETHVKTPLQIDSDLFVFSFLQWNQNGTELLTSTHDRHIFLWK